MSWLIAMLFHVPPHIMSGIERVESKGNWWAVSKSGCIGVMQICPRWSPVAWPALFIPQINRLEAARQLAGWHKRSHGDWDKAIAAYRCGRKGLLGKCGDKYVRAVLNGGR